MRIPTLLMLTCLLAILLALAPPGTSQAAVQQEPETPTPTAVAYPPPLTPTPQPSPTETEAPRQFFVSKVEPSRITPATGGAISIYGGGFVTGTAVRLVGYGLLEAVVVNATAIRAVVPPGIPQKMYTVEVILPDGTSFKLADALRVRPPKSDATVTPTPHKALIFGRPQLVIEAASTDPPTVRPGGSFTLTVQLDNLGDVTATNVRLALASPDLAIPHGGSSLMVVDLIASKGTVEVSLPLVLNAGAIPGYQSLQFTLEYTDYAARLYESQQSVGLDVGDSLSDQPLVLLSAYSTVPGELSPGEDFILQMDLTNAGESEARQLLVTLGGESGEGLSPFAILGAGNVKLVALLAPGEDIRLELRLILDGAADAGVYILPVTLAYENGAGERRSEGQMLNLLVNRRPQLQVNFYQSVAPGRVGEPLILPVELVNIGRTAVNVSTMAVGGEGLDVTSGSMFVGALEGGTTASLDAEVIPLESGTLPVQVSIHYLDDFNQAQVITQTLAVEVLEVATPTPLPGGTAGGDSSLLGRIGGFLRALFGLGS